MPPTEPDAAAGANDAEAAALAAFRDRRRPGSLVAGGSATVAIEVTPDLTAENVGSGDLPVLASPTIVRLVEQAAVALLRGRLPTPLTTVGATFGLQHDAPTPLGATVRRSYVKQPPASSLSW